MAKFVKAGDKRPLMPRVEDSRTQKPRRKLRKNGSATLLGRIRQMMAQKDASSGRLIVDVCAEAYINAMKSGSFVHAKEIFDREEGKVATKLANADGSNLKMYSGMPTEGEEAP